MNQLGIASEVLKEFADLSVFNICDDYGLALEPLYPLLHDPHDLQVMRDVLRLLQDHEDQGRWVCLDVTIEPVGDIGREAHRLAVQVCQLLDLECALFSSDLSQAGPEQEQVFMWLEDGVGYMLREF